MSVAKLPSTRRTQTANLSNRGVFVASEHSLQASQAGYLQILQMLLEAGGEKDDVP